MTQEEIVEMAKEVGYHGPNIAVFTIKDLEAFAKLVAAKEREACLNIADELALSPAFFATMAEHWSYRNAISDYQKAIRARGEA